MLILTTESLKFISVSIKNCSKLLNLTLDFQKNELFDDESLEIFILNLDFVKNLK